MSGNNEELQPGTVLFTQGNTIDPDVWDDSELIERWDRTMETYRKYSNQKKEKPPPFQQSNKYLKAKEGHIKKTTKKKISKAPIKQTIPDTKDPPPLPPMPASSSQDDISNLMMAWYYCGYYTALYQAQQQQ